MKAEEFEQEWKRYCDSKGDGAVTMNLKDVAQHFAKYGYEQAVEKAIEYIKVYWCGSNFNSDKTIAKFKKAMSE